MLNHVASAVLLFGSLTQAEPAPVAPVTPDVVVPAPVEVIEIRPPLTGGPMKWFDALIVNGFAETGYVHNVTNPGVSHRNIGRVFDKDNDQFKLDMLELVAQVTPIKPGDAGFRLRLGYGSSIPREVGVSTVIEGYASYVFPVGEGLRLDAGTFVTHVGAEVIDGYAGFNDTMSRSFLFGYAQPLSHTGAKLSYSLNDQVSVMVGLANGWKSNTRDVNDAKSLLAQIKIAPAKSVTAYLNYVGGPEQPNDNKSLRHLFDVVAVFVPIEPLTLTVNADYGMEAMSGHAMTTTWWGVAGTARYTLSAPFFMALRGEYFNDKDSFAGLGVQLMELTLAPTYKINDHFVVRGDVRWDKSLGNTVKFANKTGPTNNQVTVGAQLIAYF